MSQKLMGKKRGMTQLFDEKGNVVVCTVIEVAPNIVVQVKTKENDGYEAVQLGYDKIRVKNPRTIEKRVKKPVLGHFKKAGVEPCRHLTECRMEKTEDFQVGQEIDLSIFEETKFLDVTAMSKGKGFQGVMKLHGFAGGPAAHGSGFHRHAGSTGMRSTPGRCLPGGPRASHMGMDRVTVQNVSVVRLLKDECLVIVKGQVPGPQGGYVELSPAKKKKTKKAAKASKH